MQEHQYKRESFIFEKKEDWLDYRLREITSTESSCLFDLNPYITKQKLYILKKEKIKIELNDFHLKIGSILEKSIAKLFSIKTGKKIQRKKEYISIGDLKIGSSFDYEGEDEDGAFLVEIKNVSNFAFSDYWKADGDIIAKAPKHIELQTQHQMLVSGIHRCYICCLVGGNQLYIGERKFSKKIGDEIITRSAKFWKEIEEGKMQFNLSSDDINFYLNNKNENEEIETKEIQSDELVENLIEQYKQVLDKVNVFKKSLISLRSQIIEKYQGPAVVKSQEGIKICEIKYIKGNAGVIISSDMVGQLINKSSGYFKLNIFI